MVDTPDDTPHAATFPQDDDALPARLRRQASCTPPLPPPTWHSVPAWPQT